MAADKMKEILKHFPDLEDCWKEMEEKLKKEPAEREMLALRCREMSQRESSKEILVESDSKVMKANAPEKIYIEPNLDSIWGMAERSCESEIEYIRTDAFIEKAKSWFIQQHTGMWNEFKKYMEGE